jgi:hypothetical protein
LVYDSFTPGYAVRGCPGRLRQNSFV